MGTIKKSVKQLVIALLKEKGPLSLVDITAYIKSERETVNPAHVRGVLNADIKSGKFFKRITRGQYDLKVKVVEDTTVEGTPTVEEAIGPTA